MEASNAQDLFNTILISDGIEQGEFIDKEKAADLFRSYFDEDIMLLEHLTGLDFSPWLSENC